MIVSLEINKSTLWNITQEGNLPDAQNIQIYYPLNKITNVCFFQCLKKTKNRDGSYCRKLITIIMLESVAQKKYQR